MSLVGNLEDLSLGDILQILSLSQKTGVLALHADRGAGRVVVRSGMVCAARLKGQPNDLRELLAAEALVDVAVFDAARNRARERGCSIEETLASEVGVTPEQIQASIVKSAEGAVLEMFSWPTGDFRFDARTTLEPEDPQLIVSPGLSAQYLAMEGVRVRDEAERSSAVASGGPASPVGQERGMGLDPLFGGAPQPGEPSRVGGDAIARDEGEGLGAGTEEALRPADLVVDRILTPSGVIPSESGPDGDGPSPDGETPETRRASVTPVESGSVSTRFDAVILIEPDANVLEWTKTAMSEHFGRVHAFQQTDPGLARIRQYLIRGANPLVLLSPQASVDSLSGIRGLNDFVRRLKAQSPQIVVLALREEADGRGPGRHFDGVVARPGRNRLAGVGAGGDEDERRAFASSLCRALEGPTEESARGPEPTSSLRGLRDATAKIQRASSRAEVLPVVLDFADELFERAAILILRGTEAFAVAGRGLPRLEVDPLGPDQPVKIPLSRSGVIFRVIEERRPFCGPLSPTGERGLLDGLGVGLPTAAYLGPIECGEAVVALLYADQGEGDRALPDTRDLEGVLRQAGRALDRAALETPLQGS